MTTQFHDKEFSQMMYNPVRVPEGSDVLKFYKELSKVKEFRLNPGEGIDQNKLMLYILCMYDKHSPYRKKYNDALKRKIEVAHDVGFKTLEGGMFEDPVEDFLRGENEVVNRKIVQYIRLHRSFKYAYIVSIEAAYYNLMVDMLGGDMKNIAKLKEMQEELESNILEMLNQDNNASLKNELLRYMENERLELRPEDIAQKLQNGETPISIK